MCKVEWCSNKPHPSGRGYCRTHYDQIRKHGRILDKRTKLNPNEVIIKDNYAELILRNARGEEVARTFIDIEDIEKVRKYKWSLHNKGYVRSFYKNKTIYLHRIIMDAKEDQEIDHINLNKLDNRKCNLRFCKHVQNCWNRRSQKQGVQQTKRNLTKSYCAKIGINGTYKFLGYFYTKEEALRARKMAEEIYYKDFQCKVM